MWELLTRQLPFAGTTDQQDIIDAVVRGDRPALPPAHPTDDDTVRPYTELLTAAWGASAATRPALAVVVPQLRDLHRAASSETVA